MPSPKQIRNVTLVGGSGTVGAPILSGLIAAGHNVSVLTRPESTSTFPSTVKVHKGDYTDEAFAASALKGQDALIMALSHAAYDAQTPLIKAAATAGVPYVVPCEFGSDTAVTAHIPFMAVKAKYRKMIESLGVSSWIGVVNNPWVEFNMRMGSLGIDIKGRTAHIYDDGTTRANFTTLKRVGESLAAVLALPEAELATYKNDWVYFSSFYVSQRDLLASVVRATGTKDEDWKVVSEDSGEVIKAAKEGLAQGNMMAGFNLLFAIVFKEGWGGDYNEKLVDYNKLGLKPESLDEVMKEVFEGLGA